MTSAVDEPVSVIIPTRNRAHLIGRAVESVIRSAHPSDEVIVVDDGSDDRTLQVLDGFGSRITYLEAAGEGAGAARNRGIAAARHDLVAFLDSDDEWMPHKLGIQRSIMRHDPKPAFSFSDFAVKTADGAIHRRYLHNWHGDTRSWKDILGPGALYSSLESREPSESDFTVYYGDIYHSLLHALYVCTITVMVRRSMVGESLHFAEDLPVYEDWECFARLARAGPAAFMDCETAWNHGHAGDRLTDADEYAKVTARLTMVDRVWGSDKRFAMSNRDSLDSARDNLHLTRAKQLISRGRMHESRTELNKVVSRVPMSLAALASLPGDVARLLLSARRLVRRSLGTTPEAS